MTTFTNEMREAAKIMRERKPLTMGGFFECAKLVDGYGLEENEKDAWSIVDAHYKNLLNQDYRAVAGLSNQ